MFVRRDGCSSHRIVVAHRSALVVTWSGVLKRIYELREEIATFLNKQNYVFLAEKFS